MPNIWDLDKTAGNIQVLCNLADDNTVGKKLDLNTDGTLTIYKPTSFGIQGFRRWSSPSITSEQNFIQPIIKLFKKAKKSGTESEKINKAIQGLDSLTATYNTDITKKNSLKYLIIRIKGTLVPTGLLEFLNDYKQYATPYSFAQIQFLDGGDRGICMAFTYIWLQNKLENKDWYYTMDFIIKNLKFLKDFQEGYKKALAGTIYKKLYEVAEDLELPEIYLSDPKIEGRDKIIGDKTGSQIFNSIITAVKDMADPKMYILTLEGSNPHAMGLDIRNGRIDLFDSNFGELRFAYAKFDEFLKFCDHMWAGIYGKEKGIVIYWDIIKVDGK